MKLKKVHYAHTNNVLSEDETSPAADSIPTPRSPSPVPRSPSPLPPTSHPSSPPPNSPLRVKLLLRKRSPVLDEVLLGWGENKVILYRWFHRQFLW